MRTTPCFPSLFNPTAGLLRALDVVAPDEQKGSQDFIAGWNASSGQFLPGFPTVDNDLSFITGEVLVVDGGLGM